MFFDPYAESYDGDIYTQRYITPYMDLRITFILDSCFRIVDVGSDKLIRADHAILSEENLTIKCWKSNYVLDELTDERTIKILKRKYNGLLVYWNQGCYEERMVKAPSLIGLYYIENDFVDLILRLIYKILFKKMVDEYAAHTL